ncbi:hypothetical protein AVEN_252070-1 [Araneus ventricosus]|uniref:Uncharacterized protein n=1 Tax=Araneus ventricosus TaxID=182803 RepID=A0A4Y2P7W5_ARAVE|nr:hypothetical protein AVEN_14928-1 [Araneus ventricosus]GBN47171.1 hypothetical protein AVEN_252070-1 [Araneus ventricosus]
MATNVIKDYATKEIEGLKLAEDASIPSLAAQDENFASWDAQGETFASVDSQNENFLSKDAQGENLTSTHAPDENFASKDAQGENFASRDAQGENFASRDAQGENFASMATEHKTDFLKIELKDVRKGFDDSAMEEIDATKVIESMTSEFQSFKSEGTQYTEKDLPSSSLADEDKADFFMTKLKDIVKRFEESAKQEIFATKLIESLISDLQSITGNTKPEVIKILHIMACKFKKEADFYGELKAFSDDLKLFMNHLIVKKIEKHSPENLKKIYFNLRIVCKGIKLQIARLNSIKSNCEKFLNDFEQCRNELYKIFEIPANISRPHIMARIPDSQTTFINATNVFIKRLSGNYTLTFSVLNRLEGKVLSSLSTEQQADVIITKLKDIGERFPKSSKKEIKTRTVSESMNTELQLIQDKRTEKEKIAEFLDYIADKVEVFEDFISEMKSFFDEIESAMNNLEWEKIKHFSLEDRKKIYFNLLIARAGIRFQILRLNSIVSSCEKFREDFVKLSFPRNTPLLETGEHLSERELMFITSTKNFIKKFTDYVTSATIILERLKENTRTNVNISSPSEAGSNVSVVAEETDESKADLKKLSDYATPATILLESMKENTRTNVNISSPSEAGSNVSVVAEETDEPKADQFLNDIEKRVEVYENLAHELKVFYNAIHEVLQYVMSEGTSHLSLENKMLVYGNLRTVRQEILSKIVWLNTIKPGIEKFQGDLDNINFLRNSQEDLPLSGRLTPVITAINSYTEELGKCERVASTIIEHLEKETKTMVKIPSPAV